MAQSALDQYRNTPAETPASAGSALDQYRNEPKSSGINPWAVGAGALGLGALALAARNPAAAGEALQGVRRVSMLSGLAPLKSLLGNIGGAAYGSIERGSLAPLKEMLSPQTAREAIQAFRSKAITPNTIEGATSRFNLPGRVMGAMDTAAQNALQRAGYTAPEAAAEMLQAPVPHAVGEALDNPVAKYFVPFLKTPVNQALEGARTFKTLTQPGELGKKAALATALGTGAVSGATAEDPKTVALTTALSGRYGIPHALAAGAARYLSTGSERKAADVLQGIGPVSDYSISQGVFGPLNGQVVPKPAFFSLLKYLGLGE